MGYEGIGVGGSNLYLFVFHVFFVRKTLLTDVAADLAVCTVCKEMDARK